MRTAHRDLTDGAGRNFECRVPRFDWIIVDGNNARVDRWDRRANTDARARIRQGRSLGKNLVARNTRDWQTFGCTVGRQNFGVVGQHPEKPGHYVRRDGRASGDHSAQCRELRPVFGTVSADGVEERWRAEETRGAELLGGFDNPSRVDMAGARWIHVGNQSRHAERWIEECKGRKRRQIGLAGFNVSESPDGFDLRCEISVLVDHAFRRTGASAREEDGGDVGGFHFCSRVRHVVRARGS